ncbi:unnamed protein product, partial [Iphiclides podalirius]
MLAKFLFFAAILALASCQYNAGYGYNRYTSIGYRTPAGVIQHQPVQYSGYNGNQQNYYTAPHYSFEYSVNDPHTGDIKSQHEAREGDAVRGAYSLHESDGTVRTVEYTADAHNGFNAVVHRQGHAAHAVPVQRHY